MGSEMCIRDRPLPSPTMQPTVTPSVAKVRWILAIEPRTRPAQRTAALDCLVPIVSTPVQTIRQPPSPYEVRPTTTTHQLQSSNGSSIRQSTPMRKHSSQPRSRRPTCEQVRQYRPIHGQGWRDSNRFGFYQAFGMLLQGESIFKFAVTVNGFGLNNRMSLNFPSC